MNKWTEEYQKQAEEMRSHLVSESFNDMFKNFLQELYRDSLRNIEFDGVGIA